MALGLLTFKLQNMTTAHRDCYICTLVIGLLELTYTEHDDAKK